MALGLVATIALVIPKPATSQDGLTFDVMVTNLTRGEQFTPILAATHDGTVNLFTLGSPSTPELAMLAEEGNTAPLMGLLTANPAVHFIVTSSGLLAPGGSTHLSIQARQTDSISLAAMLIPTNDGFFAVNNVELPKGSATLTVFSPAYDAGSEMNDELCASIPGPFFIECNGPGGGGMPSGGEEGYVHIHGGIHGIGNLLPQLRDWRNPVAQIVVRRMQR